MRTLVFLTDRFPYGNGEAFIENEIPYLADSFDKIFVFPTGLTVNTDYMRPLPDNFVVLPPANTDDLYRNGRPSKMKRVLWSMKHMLPWCISAMLSKEFWCEIGFMRKHHILNFTRMVAVVRALAPLKRNNRHFKKQIKPHLNQLNGPLLMYSYWSDYSVYTLQRILKGNVVKIVARTHGHDLYNERRACGYIPFRHMIYETVHKLCLISEDGYEYVGINYPDYQDKYNIAYLGTKDHGVCTKDENENLVIVSCAHVIPVKRIDRIAEALSEIKNGKVVWYHFGGGQDYHKLKEKCGALLSSQGNIEYHMVGAVNNAELMEFYKENKVDLFINVSESEGLPVSIMEAMSFGIPIIATDVGSSRETIIKNRNGILLTEDFTNTELTDAIRFYLDLSTEERQMQCKASRELWEKKFSAANNYPEFFEKYFKE